MKIAIITAYWNPPMFVGGISSVVFELRKVWLSQGHEVHVFACDATENDSEGIFKITVPKVPLRALLFSFILSKSQKIKQYDIVFPQTAILAFFLRKQNCAPFIHTLSSVERKNPLRFWRYAHGFFEKKALGGIRKCFVLSEDTRMQLINNRGVLPECIVKIRNGVDFSRFQSHPSHKEHQFIVLSAGRFIPRKRFDLLIKAFSVFTKKYPKGLLLIAGKGELEGDLKKLVVSLGVTENVKFLGHVAQDKMIELYAQASIFILPSIAEGMPMVVLEAQACGLPCIIGNFASAREVVEENVTGYILNSADPVDWALKIEELYVDKMRLVHFGKNARRRVMGEFSWDSTASKIIDVFNALKNDGEVK